MENSFILIQSTVPYFYNINGVICRCNSNISILVYLLVETIILY